jgi:hypothetical protein
MTFPIYLQIGSPFTAWAEEGGVGGFSRKNIAISTKITEPKIACQKRL